MRFHRCCCVVAGLVALLLADVVPAASAAGAQADNCLEAAATWAHVHPTLLRAIAWVESRGNPRALNWNANGSYDTGLMQINSWWYDRGLAPIWLRLGDPCVNVAVGTWVLKQCLEEYGYTWEAVGCYHAGSGWHASPTRRAEGHRYIRLVQSVVHAALVLHTRKDMLLTESGLRTTVPPVGGRTP